MNEDKTATLKTTKPQSITNCDSENLPSDLWRIVEKHTTEIICKGTNKGIPKHLIP